MPELPEVECVRRSLEVLEGAVIESVEVRRRDFVSSSKASERRHPMAGATIDRIVRHGKELALVERGPRRLRMRLGMTGRLLVERTNDGRGPARLPHEHVRWIARGTGDTRWVLRSVDPRRFGDLVVFETEEDFEQDRTRLGPDALSIRSRELAQALSATRRAIKIALLDQKVLAGVGNIYADEALFAVGVHPATPANRLARDAVSRLSAAIRSLLRRSISAGGTTIRDYRNGSNEPGTAQRHLKVYGRQGEACHRCRTDLEHTVMGQRTTTWCPKCQQLIHITLDNSESCRLQLQY